MATIRNAGKSRKIPVKIKAEELKEIDKVVEEVIEVKVEETQPEKKINTRRKKKSFNQNKINY